MQHPLDGHEYRGWRLSVDDYDQHRLFYTAEQVATGAQVVLQWTDFTSGTTGWQRHHFDAFVDAGFPPRPVHGHMSFCWRPDEVASVEPFSVTARRTRSSGPTS